MSDPPMSPEGRLRSWRHAAVGLAGFSVLMYGFGLLLVGSSEWAEMCIGRGVRFDPAYEFRQGLWPLSRPCNAEYDLVPSWINAAVALLVAATLVCLVVTVRLSWRQRTGARTGD